MPANASLWSCPITRSQVSSLELVVNRFLMKLFSTDNIEINYYRDAFCFNFLSTTLIRCTDSSVKKLIHCDSLLVKGVYTPNVAYSTASILFLFCLYCALLICNSALHLCRLFSA